MSKPLYFKAYRIFFLKKTNKNVIFLANKTKSLVFYVKALIKQGTII